MKRNEEQLLKLYVNIRENEQLNWKKRGLLINPKILIFNSFAALKYQPKDVLRAPKIHNMMHRDKCPAVKQGKKKKLNVPVRTEKEPIFGRSAGWVEFAIKKLCFWGLTVLFCLCVDDRGGLVLWSLNHTYVGCVMVSVQYILVKMLELWNRGCN